MQPKSKSSTCSQNPRVKLYIWIAVGFVLLTLAIVSILVDPFLIFLRHMTRIEMGSEVYDMLQKEIPGAYVHVYIFNVTNSKDFISGKDEKLKVEEVGPFVYREYRRNEGFQFDQVKGVMRYKPVSWTKFLPEKSIGDPHLINVTVPNIVLLATASMISEQYYVTKTLFNVYVKKYSPILNLDVHSQLWGYDDPLISIGNTFFPGLIPFKKMGILDRLYDQTLIPHLEVGTTNADKFRIKTLNDSPGLLAREYDNPSKRTRCNTLDDTYEGIAYPGGLTSETKLRMYRNVFCRMLDLDFLGTRTIDYGPEAFVYKISNDTYKIGPHTECLCNQHKCKDGVTDLSPCVFNFPISLSNAHFLHADPILYDRIEGIHPDAEQHDSEIIVDPKIGAVLDTRFTLQVNVDVEDVRFSSVAAPFSNMVVPLAYFKIMQDDIPEEGKVVFRKLYFKLAYFIYGFQICASILGILILAYAARQICWNIIYPKKDADYQITNEKGLNLGLQGIEPLMDEKPYTQIQALQSEE